MIFPIKDIDIKKIFGSPIIGDSKNSIFRGVSTDSRSVKDDDLFFALKGDKFNGYDYLDIVKESGVKTFIVNRNDFEKNSWGEDRGVSVYLVEDTIVAYGDLAKFFLNKISGKKIAITGSSGKTTVKEMLKLMLSAKYNVFASEKNYNNHIGVPMSIFSISEEYDYYIFEMGMNHKGEIDYLSKIVSPDITLITNVNEAHIEFFDNITGIASAKAEIFNGQSVGGNTYLNCDDKFFDFLKERALKKNISVNTFSQEKLTYLFNEHIGSNTLLYDDSNEVSISFSGEYNLSNVAAAMSVAVSESVLLEKALDTLSYFRNGHSRFEIFTGFPLIVDDSYNANPTSMIVSINEFLNMFSDKRLILVLGDMFELGKYAKSLHDELIFKINNLLSDLKPNCEFVFLGKMMKSAYRKINSKEKQYFSDNLKATEYLKKNVDKDTVCFFKASNGMKLFNIVKEMRCSTT